jgi:hypothetical protein
MLVKYISPSILRTTILGPGIAYASVIGFSRREAVPDSVHGIVAILLRPQSDELRPIFRSRWC